MCNNSKLIYTTDEKDPQFRNNMESSGISILETETVEEARETITAINKSIRRSAMKGVKGFQDPMAILKRENELKRIVALIFEKPRTTKEIHAELGKDKITQTDNVMQTIRYAACGTIKSENGIWKINEDNTMVKECLTLEKLQELVIANKSNLWKSKLENKKNKKTKGSAPIEKPAQPKEAKPIRKTVTIGDKSIDITNGPVELSFNICGITILLKIGAN